MFCFQADRTYTQCLRPNLLFSLSFAPARTLALTPTRIGATGCTTRAHARYTHLLRTDEVTHSRREGEGGGWRGGEKEEDRSTERASDYFGSTGRWYLRAALSNRTRQPTFFPFSSPLSISRFLLFYLISPRLLISEVGLNSTAPFPTPFAVHLLLDGTARSPRFSRFKCQPDVGRGSSRRSDLEVVSVFFVLGLPST